MWLIARWLVRGIRTRATVRQRVKVVTGQQGKRVAMRTPVPRGTHRRAVPAGTERKAISRALRAGAVPPHLVKRRAVRRAGRKWQATPGGPDRPLAARPVVAPPLGRPHRYRMPKCQVTPSPIGRNPNDHQVRYRSVERFTSSFVVTDWPSCPNRALAADASFSPG